MSADEGRGRGVWLVFSDVVVEVMEVAAGAAVVVDVVVDVVVK